MQITRHILTIALVFAMLASGLPLFSPEDANRDSSVDLMDTILSVRGFANSADYPDTFTSNIEKTLAALNIAAGLKTVIKPNRGEKSLNTFLSPNLPYLSASCAFFISPGFTSEITEYTNLYKSIESAPVSPPPQLA